MTDQTMIIGLTVLSGTLFLLIGGMIGWLGAERYITLITHRRHEYENLFDENPHPEIYDKDGKLNRGEYIAISFDPEDTVQFLLNDDNIELVDEDEEE